MIDNRILVALGGNALTKQYSQDSYRDQRERIRSTVIGLVDLIDEGLNPIFTHGNGPQVGNLLIQQEKASDEVPPMPIDACGAMTQGFIGYLLQQQIRNGLRRKGMERDVTTLVTEVLVDPEDPEFEDPTKPVGPSYPADEAEKLQEQRGWKMNETHFEAYRRVVPSPEPLEILQEDAIGDLVESGKIVISTGGGGVPVIREVGDEEEGIEAVVDKDIVGAKLAQNLECSELLILTAVEHAEINYRTPEAEPLGRISISEAKRHYEDGQFPPGSMGPKVRGAINFVENGGKRGTITHVNKALEGYREEVGTHIVPDEEV